MKKYLRTSIAIALLAAAVFGGISHAQNSTQTTLDPFKVASSTVITPRTPTNSLRLPYLGSTLSPCLYIKDSAGNVASTTCGTIGAATTTIAGLTANSFLLYTTSTPGISTSTPNKIYIGPASTTVSQWLNDAGYVSSSIVLTYQQSSSSTINTAVGPFTFATSGPALAIQRSGAAFTWALPTSTASITGVLSSADWTTFNNKVATTRNVTTTLTGSIRGGGDLSADRSLFLALGNNATQTCGGGSFVSSLTATGTIACTTPSASGITSLNGLNGATQTFATSGPALSITSSGTAHTFSVPTSTASVTGVLTGTDWTTFNSKESALTFTTNLVRATNTVSVTSTPSFTTVTATNVSSTNATTTQLSITGLGTSGCLQMSAGNKVATTTCGAAATDPVVRTYVSTSTPATWTKPGGLRYVIMEIQGAGGGGSGKDSSASEGDSGAGGGGGGFCRRLVLAATLNATSTVTVGDGGAAGLGTNGSGGDGGTSSFGAFCSATGGKGGVGNSAADINPGGAGGVGSSGDINASGSSGGNGSSEQGGLTASGVAGGGVGGGSHFGGGGRGGGGGAAEAGQPGLVYGGGGGGGYGGNGGAAAGGMGAIGIVIVTEYY